MIFPRLVYKSASNHKLVEDAGAMETALSAGWFATVPEALSGVPVQRTDAQPTRAEMEQKATELGLKFDGRTSEAKLMRLIDEALEK